ncbi:uncharacterized protein PHACADRAFT_257114 [Phanerochaete carnosa HHB-10118-sp]|uniref:Uncharacterized protein n=1 Tax=Phanerochaete carnosa (strain HHB-10118-sp) TaxID=650164 RepID=K5V0R2_PHACS|nr:uncharacterized protein PHACADRAFT_257114 [Phanerochaete carnosa HHB-10118-sp]EKM56066.1 hypothetical protein PHACADRAFT_257114 [Phanerochaete carnosa HHB-10118-sp]
MEALRVGNLDLVGMAQQAMWYIPTLLFVAVGHSYPPERRVFKVANDGDSPESVKKLSDVVTGSAAWDEFWGTTMYKPWWNPDCSWYSDE